MSSSQGRPGEVFAAFLRLGLVAFGGPVAHLGYFRHEFVVRRRWLTDTDYADLVALSHFLPGPASSQVGFALGLRRAGAVGGLAAWAGFTLPSALLMTMFAYVAVPLTAAPGGAGLLHGLKLAAVAQALLQMAGNLCRGPVRAAVALAAGALVLVVAGFPGQMAAMAFGAAVGAFLLKSPPPGPSAATPGLSRRAGAVCLGAFAALLAVALAAAAAGDGLGQAAAFYRSGALVFGGGHVVAPLLAEAVVQPGGVTPEAFLQGYGAAQALPGPLFAFAAYLGAVTGGLGSGVLALVAIFLPGLLLMAGALPFWVALRNTPRAAAAIAGVGAATVGLLTAALYDPIFIGSVTGWADMLVAATALAMLVFLRAPALVAVVFCALAGVALDWV
jgi:chromate transporter